MRFSPPTFVRWKQPGTGPILIGALSLGLIVQGIRLAYVIATPVTPLGHWQPALPDAMPVAARRALFAHFDPFNRQQVTTAGSETVTSLDLQLFGITVNAATGGGSAIMAGADGIQNSFAVGMEVMPGVNLHAVADDHVVLDRGGVRETLYIDQSVPAETVSSGNAQSATGGDTAMTADTVKAGLSLTPRKEGARITGLAVSPAGDGALFARMGLQRGDVIIAVNDRPISSPADMANLPQLLTPGARLSLKIERGSDVVPIALNLD